jgi:hypothetical protein
MLRVLVMGIQLVSMQRAVEAVDFPAVRIMGSSGAGTSRMLFSCVIDSLKSYL